MPTGLPGRLLALTILIIGIATLYVGIAAPALGYYQDREAELGTQRLLAKRLRAAAAEMPELRAGLAELRQVANTKKMTLDGSSDALAAAALQSRIEELAAAAGVTIASSEGVPAETRGNYRRIGLRMAVSGTYEAIVQLLAAIDATNPPLMLDSLQIHGNARIASSRAATLLDAAYVVYGFRVGEKSAGAQP